MIDRKNFYTSIKKTGLFSSFSQAQVNCIEAVFNEWDDKGYQDLRWLAYMLATIYHETAKTMQPIEEYGKGKIYPYGKKIKRSKVSYVTPNQIYYGRGFVQLTWYENYELMDKLLHIDLLNHPELALDLKNAVAILFEGMLKGSSSFGDFTGKCLEMYFNDTTEDWLNARKIINGLDKAELIKSYAMKIYTCLNII